MPRLFIVKLDVDCCERL